MKRFTIIALWLIFLLAACATGESSKPSVVSLPTGGRQIKAVYVWDADGHTDLNLLRGLKSEAGRALKDRGLAVSDSAETTDAYVKITVLDAGRDAEKGRSFVRARLYIVDAKDSSIIYDKTAEASASGGGDNGPEYPVEKVIKSLLADYH